MKKNNLICITIGILGLLILFYSINTHYFYYLNKDFSQEAIEKCKQIINSDCEPFEPVEKCQDGFSENCYYDSREYNKSNFDAAHSFSEKDRIKCIGIHSSNFCDCTNNFELNLDGNYKEMSCKEFFTKINNYNATCNGCIEKTSVGCC